MNDRKMLAWDSPASNLRVLDHRIDLLDLLGEPETFQEVVVGQPCGIMVAVHVGDFSDVDGVGLELLVGEIAHLHDDFANLFACDLHSRGTGDGMHRGHWSDVVGVEDAEDACREVSRDGDYALLEVLAITPVCCDGCPTNGYRRQEVAILVLLNVDDRGGAVQWPTHDHSLDDLRQEILHMIDAGLSLGWREDEWEEVFEPRFHRCGDLGASEVLEVVVDGSPSNWGRDEDEEVWPIEINGLVCVSEVLGGCMAVHLRGVSGDLHPLLAVLLHLLILFWGKLGNDLV